MTGSDDGVQKARVNVYHYLPYCADELLYHYVAGYELAQRGLHLVDVYE